MSTKKLLFSIIAMLTLTLSVTAQNLSQKDANTYLTGSWHAGGKVLTFIDNGGARAANIFGADYTYWSIYTNTFDFSAGSVQATNSNPQRNISLKYRFLTQTTCEFLIDGNWVSARKGAASGRPVTSTSRPTTNTVTRPVATEGGQSGTFTMTIPDNNGVPVFTNDPAPRSPSNDVSSPSGNNVSSPSGNTVSRPSPFKGQRPSKGKVTRPSTSKEQTAPSNTNKVSPAEVGKKFPGRNGNQPSVNAVKQNEKKEMQQSPNTIRMSGNRPHPFKKKVKSKEAEEKTEQPVVIN